MPLIEFNIEAKQEHEEEELEYQKHIDQMFAAKALHAKLKQQAKIEMYNQYYTVSYGSNTETKQGWVTIDDISTN